MNVCMSPMRFSRELMTLACHNKRSYLKKNVMECRSERTTCKLSRRSSILWLSHNETRQHALRNVVYERQSRAKFSIGRPVQKKK